MRKLRYAIGMAINVGGMFVLLNELARWLTSP